VRVLFPVGFTIGIDYERDNVHYKLGLKVPNAPDSITTIADVSPQETRGVYTQAIISLSRRLHLTAGLRVDHIRIPYIDQLVDSNSGTNLYDRFSPELGLNYSFTDDVKAYAAYKVGFRAPAALELACASPDAPCSLPSALGADPHLDPVTTHDYEGGLDIELSRRSSVDVSAFWTDVYNDIQFASPNLIQAYYFNVARTRRAGVETSARLGLPGRVDLLASYSYVAATYQTTVQIATADTNPQPTQPGNLFPNSPLHRWRLGAETNRQLGPASLAVAIDAKGYSSQYLRGDEANRRPQIPGYTLTSFQAQLSLHRYSVHLEVENLLNDRHTEFGVVGQDLLFPPGAHISLDEANGPIVPFLSPGMPRRFTVTVSVRF
jgi:iron complex outermembrane recepter protein